MIGTGFVHHGAQGVEENGNGEELMNKSVICNVNYMRFDNELEMSK